MRVIKQVDFKHEALGYQLAIKMLTNGNCQVDLTMPNIPADVPVFESGSIEGGFIGLVDWLVNRDMRDALEFCDQIEYELQQRLINPDGPDLSFSGMQLATVDDQASKCKYTIWITTQGNLITTINNAAGRFDWEHMENTSYARMQLSVIEFFGWSAAAKELYTQCGIDTYIELK